MEPDTSYIYLETNSIIKYVDIVRFFFCLTDKRRTDALVSFYYTL